MILVMYFLSFYRSTSSGLLFRRVNSKMERVFTFASITINAVSVCLSFREVEAFVSHVSKHTYDTNVGRV